MAVKAKDIGVDRRFCVTYTEEGVVRGMTDLFDRIWAAREQDTKIVLLLPNPSLGYRKLSHLINAFALDCSHVYVFLLDEYADAEGNIAPESYPQDFLHAFKKHFYANTDPELRPPEQQIIGLTNGNMDHYGTMITDLGGADACYTGPGWTGHVGFVEPDAPEFEADLDDWKGLGPRIVTLSPFTIAQNSLHGSFGAAGDLAAAPPKAATIGPAQVIEAKYRMERHGITISNSIVSCRRFISRLVLHGPVTPKIPASIIRELGADVIVAETVARDIEPYWDMGY